MKTGSGLAIKILEYEDILNNPKSMKKVIKKDLDHIRKEYALNRKTVVEDGKEAVYEEDPIKEQTVYFVMDRFGYSKTLDQNTFNRNEETILKEGDCIEVVSFVGGG